MLTHLSVKNFKSWRNLPNMEFGKITALFGPNNSGKTSLLKLLLMLKQTVESRDRTLLNLGGDVQDYVNLGDYAQIAYLHNEQNHIDISVTWRPTLDQKASSLLYRIRSTWKKNNDLISQVNLEQASQQTNNKWMGIKEYDELEWGIPVETIEFYDEEVSNLSSANKTNLAGLFSEHPFYEIRRDLSPYLNRANFQKLNKEAEHGFRYLFKRTYYLGPLRAQPKREYRWSGEGSTSIGVFGEYTIEALLTENRKFADYTQDSLSSINIWLKRLGIADRLNIYPLIPSLYEVRIHTDQTENYANLVDVGFGVSQVLPIVTLAYLAPPESIIILEQPELHLHPKVQAELADLFLEVAQTRNIQFIIESHSEHLLARLQRRLAERSGVNEHLTENDVRLYFCQREGSESTLQPLQLDQYGQIQNWPPDFFGDLLDERLKAMEAMAFRQQKAQTNGQAAQ